MTATYSICSPPSSGNAAIAIVEVRGDADAVLRALRVTPVPPPRAVLRSVPDVDTLVVARPAADRLFLFPHAGPAILRRLFRALEACGATPAAVALEDTTPNPDDPRDALAQALSRAASPLAIDLLLDQPRRWAEKSLAPVSPEHARTLGRLIDPPLVVALGPPNIGKSSLLNALAGRTVAIVADQPGTTRDHVGALIDFGGVVARYIDAPGIGTVGAAGDRDIQEASQSLATKAAASADLILLCGDRQAGFLETPVGGSDHLRLALRADLGLPEAPFDVAVSLRAGQPPPASYRTDAASDSSRLDLISLVAAVRERLVPDAALADAGRWAFWKRDA